MSEEAKVCLADEAIAIVSIGQKNRVEKRKFLLKFGNLCVCVNLVFPDLFSPGVFFVQLLPILLNLFEKVM